jgi:hypothetical protein
MSIPGFHDDYGHDFHSVPIDPHADKWSRGEPTLEEVAAWLNMRMGWDMYDEYDCARKALDLVIIEAMRKNGQT